MASRNLRPPARDFLFGVAASAATRHYALMQESVPKVDLQLWRADALVIFDWLMTVDLNAVPITHPAQKQALVDLLARLETDTDVPLATASQIAEAQAEVAREMGW